MPRFFLKPMNITDACKLPAFNFTHKPSETSSVKTVDGIKIITSEPVSVPFLFDSLVLSLNYRTDTDGCVLLEAQVHAGGIWSRFYKLGLFSKKFQSSFAAQRDDAGAVDVDVLKLFVPADAYRYRLSLYGDVEILHLAGAVTNANARYDAVAAERMPSSDLEAVVCPVSQLEISHKDKKRICSPVSLTMALKYLGANMGVADVLPGVFDPSADIYGNWLFNTAYAGLCGLESFVRYFNSLAELEDFVTPDGLVLASIAYKKGELAGAAVDKTPGHLVVIRGFRDGKILVADPAAPTAGEVNRAYDAAEFANAWLKNKKGVSYIVRKR